MVWFALIAIVLAGMAVLLLVVPLLRTDYTAADSPRDANVSIYRDQVGELERDVASGTLSPDQLNHARGELEQRLLDELRSSPQATPRPGRSAWLAALAVGISLPVCAALLYLHLGNPGALTAPKQGSDAPSITVDQFEEMTRKLASRLEKQPNDAVGWMMLGRAYKALERYPDAVKALQRAEQLQPRNPEIIVEYAEALALNHGRNLDGEPTRLLERALQIAPDNEKALTLAGAAAFARNDYATAARYWQQLVAKLPPDSELARALSTGIAEAKARSAGKRTQANPMQQADSASKTLSGVIQLSPTVASRASPDDTVFVFARAVSGPKMPLAVLKRQVKDLPLTFELDDSMAMRPGLALSSFPRVVVSARISKSGSPTPTAGDLEGQSAVVAPGAKGVLVTIDSSVP